MTLGFDMYFGSLSFREFTVLHIVYGHIIYTVNNVTKYYKIYNIINLRTHLDSEETTEIFHFCLIPLCFPVHTRSGNLPSQANLVLVDLDFFLFGFPLVSSQARPTLVKPTRLKEKHCQLINCICLWYQKIVLTDISLTELTSCFDDEFSALLFKASPSS